jgi:hypothetical protein
MTNPPNPYYLVIRLVPESPVDGGTFSTYLDDLTIQAVDAYTQKPVSGQAYVSPLNLVEWPPGSSTYQATASQVTSADSNYTQGGGYGTTLEFGSTAGISVGAYAYTADGTTIQPGSYTVTQITSTTVTLNQALANFVAADTVVSFISVLGQNGAATVDTTQQPPVVALTCEPSSGTPAGAPSTLDFPSGQTNGIPVGAQVSSAVAGLVQAGTTVTGASQGSTTIPATLDLSLPLNGTLPTNTSFTLTFTLSQGIVQHTEKIPDGWFFGTLYAVIPAAAATAIVQLTQAPPPYLDITINATRGTETILDSTVYYNVQVQQGAIPPIPGTYPAIPATDTSLYFFLPPPPTLGSEIIGLETSGDGTPPQFELLYPAIQSALANDPAVSATANAVTLINSPAQCRRIAYDIVWSYQNTLPPLPDPLESLYTNPPNPGGGGSATSGNNGGTNNFEMDRQKFEGALNSFYATRNGAAERLTKFVAAASAALACEQFSLAATSALIEFPVDPLGQNVTFANAVESEILLTGLGTGGAADIPFGVPANFFYALGTSLDKTTSAAQRFQLATGDSIDRLLQLFTAAQDSDLIVANGPQPFSPNVPQPPPGITPFQAARRLAALGVSGASNSPQVTVAAGTQLAALVSAWLDAPDPSGAQSPPPTYQQNDFTVWSQLAQAQPTGYLDLDLDALTQGYPVSPGVTLADEIAAWLATLPGAAAPPTVQTLKQVTPAQWTSFFTANPQWLPTFTQPVPGTSSASTQSGYTATRIRAFIRAVQQFFTISSAPTSSNIQPAGAIPDFALPAYDPISLTGLTFNSALSGSALTAAAQHVFPDDQAAQDWLVQAMTTINELWMIATAATSATAPTDSSLTPPMFVPSFAFSVMEAMYARGFLSAADILALSGADFQLAMTGTVGYDYAGALYTAAQNPAFSPAATSQPDAGFVPINPDGSLVDCVPPPCLSPTGPIAYLQAMLATAPPSTASQSSPPTLGTVLSQRRGPVGSLAASAANLETPLPLIDLVNECLEYLVATAGSAGTLAASGTEYDTTTQADDNPVELLAAIPQHSTPATPDAANTAVEPTAFNKLKADFSACLMPYSQALDVSRSYLCQLGSSRFEEMRTFRRCITEFVLDPAQEPAGFESWLWRYPVSADIAIEFLCITPEEYATLFQDPASQGSDVRDTAPIVAGRGTITLPTFLAQTCLTYCEFYELWASGFVSFQAGSDDKGQGDGTFPECEPCCPEEVWLQFPEQQQEQDPFELLVFVWLWRKLRECRECRGGYSFAELRDICDVLQLWEGNAPNPDFIRQLAAFQMLREEFRLELTDPAATVPPGAVDAERTQLLALWTGPGATGWPWAVRQLLAKVEEHARRRPGCTARSPEFVKLLTANLDPLSRLAGFDPDSPTDSWHALPTHTLRFAEVLSKVYASDFSVGELIYLFTADPHLDGDDPFPLQEENEALDDPLGLPADDPERELKRLRAELLDAEAEDADGDEAEAAEWPWRRIESALQTEFGFAAADVTALGQHFFPGELARAGQAAPPSSACFVSPLTAGSTSAAMWNNPPDGPFRYDPAAGTAGQLSASIPLTDRAVLGKLTGTQDLDLAERRAVQDLFFQPRAMLAGFALLFADFAQAQRILVEEPDERLRFGYFRRQFLACRRRAHLIAAHLARHVAAVTGQETPDHDAAALILRTLAGDENPPRGSWENDDGAPPGLTTPLPGGGALAALLGLAGTGLTAEYTVADGPVAWRDLSAGLGGFGHERDRENCPVPTVLPALDTMLTPQQMRYVSVHNGLLMKDATGAWLGGAQGFSVTWSGALLIERDGTYEFWAGAPTPGEDSPDAETAGDRQWRVVLRRGQRTWVILSHHWNGTEEHPAASLPLKRGAYELTAEFVQPVPEFRDEEDIRPERTGFQVKYRGPDSDGRRVEIPHRALFTIRKDQPLYSYIQEISPGAMAYLEGLYYSSLRDIRRTYQRAFKALLFCHRLRLSARRQPHGTSELGYLLSQPQLFAGSGYYQSAGAFTRHAADFDFDFLPLRDDYHPPTPATDSRSNPSPQRIQAMFDWWERLFDYTIVRDDVRRRDGRPVWHLFEEALDKQPADPGYLLRHLDADERHWQLDLRYFQGQNSQVYEVTSADLCDDRWTVRAWHADRWLRAAQYRFAAPDIETARPDLWASDDPSALVQGETQTGNANLLAYVTEGCLDGGEPRRYDELRLLNDGLRERGRRALIAYLCHGDRLPLPWQPGQFATTPGDLSDLLLLDVEAGLYEKASRIEEACSAAQAFVRRSRLGLEPEWPVTSKFAQLWQTRFETYRTWTRARHREQHRENWIEWDEIARARRVEAFRFLESQLRTSTLTLAAPGGMDWWADDERGLEHAPELLQRRVPSHIRALPAPLVPPPPPSQSLSQPSSQSSSQPAPTTREGFTILGSPDWTGQPTWLAAVQQPRTPQTGSGTSGTADTSGTAPGTSGTVRSLATATVDGSAAPQTLPLWMQAAMKLGTRFTRVAAAGIPEAASRFVPPPGPFGGGVDEYYFWLIPAQVYTPCADNSSSATGDSTFTGTYQFGYQDPYYDEVQQQSDEWDDPTQVPQLLASWLPGQAVRLAWCRVHDGQFGQPRRSTECVPVDGQPDLVFLGRAWDSLTFEVSQTTPPQPPSTSGSGFRYDLASDQAVALPEVLPAPNPTTTYPDPLPSYPFFVYERPGARLFPASWFATSLTVAGALRARCGYELALRWYGRAFKPLQADCAWMHCPDSNGTHSGSDADARGAQAAPEAPVAAAGPTQDQISQRAHEIWEQHGEHEGEAAQDWQQAIAELQAEEEPTHPPQADVAAQSDAITGRPPGACCDASQVTDQGARNRAVTLHYCRTLVEWGDAVMRSGHSPEAFQQARVLYETAARITGRRPRTILLPEPANRSTVMAFVPAYAPLNPQLMDIYDLVADRLELIRRSVDERRLRNGRPGRDMPYFGDVCDMTGEVPDEEDWCGRPSPYRFLSQIQKAIELAGRVRELGAALLSAYEKGDAEYLAALRAEQEREMLALGIAIRQDQWRDADWQVQALQQTKDLNQANLLYYAGLYQNGLLNDENQNLDLTASALATRTGANLIETVGEIMNIIPDPFVGAMSSGASVPAGTKLAHLFEAIARIMQTVADIMSTNAAMDLTLAGWQRRAAEWLHQTQTLPIEIEQIELQILGAHRRRHQALRELNNQQRQVEHATEVLDFLRDKFTATDLYLWLQQETAALYRQMYELALRAAREAERSFNFELRNGVQRFLPEETWDNLHAGLLAGERLDLALRRMEKAYLDQNRRELELTEHISLRLDFPLAYLRLRVTGSCEITIPEWMFNRHYPSHYMLRLAAVSVTAPVVASQLTGVYARLTLLSSMTRISPEVRPPAQHCCRDGHRRSEYAACAKDPRIVRDYAARESIATSSGQNDSGLFELSFRDERLLPDQFQGAAGSTWRIELPPENNYFDLDTLTDFVLDIHYTAREGGVALGEAAARDAREHLPGDGLRVFDVRHDFPDAWPGLRVHGPRQLRLGFTRSMFPFVPGHPERVIDRLLLMFAAPDAASGRHHAVRFWEEGADRDRAAEIECVADEAWPGFFRAAIDLREHPLGPLREDRPVVCVFEIPAQAGKIRTAFILASYDVTRHDRAAAACRCRPEG